MTCFYNVLETCMYVVYVVNVAFCLSTPMRTVLNRFIEGNKIESISKNAFRGLRDLTHL